ncbi:MAG: response regulator [Planctomycetes bacterium]|nr:response regulator [Planctomycetota bacterium]
MNMLLVAENDTAEPMLRDLASAGFTVCVVRDGWDAIVKLLEHPFDLVVLDIAWADTTGLGALSRMLAKRPSLPVIIHRASRTFQEQFLTWRKDAYVVKYPSLGELKLAIAKALASRDAGKEASHEPPVLQGPDLKEERPCASQ